MKRHKKTSFYLEKLCLKIVFFILISIQKTAFGAIEVVGANCDADLEKLAQKIQSQNTLNALDLDSMLEVINRPLKNQSDLDALVATVEALDPEVGAMIKKAKAAGVSIRIGNKSHVKRDYHQIINRSTTFAKSVIIARDSNTSLFELIHEIRHAVPHTEAESVLKLDPKTQSVEQMEAALQKHFYLDEAHSIEAEIKLLNVLESLGFQVDYDVIRPGVRNTYQQGGLQAVADNLHTLVPNYEKHYTKMSRELVAGLVDPKTSTASKSWSYAGVEVKSSAGRIELSLDSKKLLENLSDSQHPLAQILAPLIDKAKTAFKKLSNVADDGVAEKKMSVKHTTKEELSNIKFKARPEPKEKSLPIELQASQNIERVKITGHYLDILEKQVAAGITEGDHFYDYLSIAESSYGRRSSDLYQKLLDDLMKDTGKAVDEKTYKKIRDLGYSLLRSGYKEEGRKILSHVIDEHISERTVIGFGMPLFDELVKLEEDDLAMRIIPFLDELLKSSIGAHQRRELGKIEDYVGHYTSQGQQLVNKFLAENNNRLVSYKEIREFRKKLHREGHLVLKREDSHLIREGSFNSEGEYLIYLGKVVSHSGQLTKAAREVQSRNPSMAAALNQTASRLDHWRMKAQERSVAQKIEDWQARLGNFEAKKGDSLYTLSLRVEELPNVNKDYNFCNDLQDAPISSASSLFMAATRSSFQAALDILDKIPASAQKVIPFEHAVKNLPKDLSEVEFSAFMHAWERVLNESVNALAEVNFVEDISRTNLHKVLDQTQSFKSQFPSSNNLTSLHCEQRLLMAQAFLERPEAPFKQKGRDLIAELPASTKEHFNKREYISHRHFVHGVKPSGWSIYQLNFFSPIDFKIKALVQASSFDPQNAQKYLKDAYELSKSVNLNPDAAQLHDFENKLYHQWLLAEALYRNNFLDEARELRSRMSAKCLIAEQAHSKRVQAFERLPEVERDQDFNTKWAIKNDEELIKFWMQHLDSKMKADEALLLSRSGASQSAVTQASELVSAMTSDVRQRRNRFDVMSMIQAAASLSESSVLREHSFNALKVCHEKLALLRGEKELFNKGIVYFMDQVKASHLSVENQDTLLTELVQGIVPKAAGESVDWKALLDSGAPLLKVIKSINESGQYPKAELESLQILSELTEKIHFNRDAGKWGNQAAIATLRSLYEEITKRHPELCRDSNLPALQNLSAQTSHRKALTHLFPHADQVSTSKSLVVDGKIDMLRLQTGKYDRAQASKEVGRELRTAFSENNDVKLKRALSAYEVLFEHDLSQARAQRPNQIFIELSELMELPAFKELESLLGGKLDHPNSRFDAKELEVLKTLFGARTQEVATSKYNLFRQHLNNPNSPIEALHLSFEGLHKRGSISEYVWQHFDQELRSAGVAEQRLFCKRISRLLDDHNHKLPDDTLMAYTIKHQDKADEFIDLLGRSKSNQVMSSQEVGGRRYIDLHTIRDMDDFNRTVDRLSQQTYSNGKEKFWIPSLTDPIQLIVAHQKRFEWFMQFPQYLNAIKAVYVDQTYNCVGRISNKYAFAPEHLEKAVSEIIPGFKLSPKERERLLQFFEINRFSEEYAKDWPEGRGTISFKQFREIFPRSSFSESQADQLMEFLGGPPSVFTETVIETFGKIPTEAATIEKIEHTLNELRRDFNSRVEHIASFQKLPEVIKEQPEVVRFLMSSFFRQLPFGQRDAILREFAADTKPLSSDQALRRFFELTGTEKIGQFLSTRRDLIPESFRKELEVFLENGAPSSFEEVRSTIEGELGKPITAVFKSLNSNPLNVGTIGEVYEGILLDGTRVVVKVITRSRKESILEMLKRLEVSCDKLEGQKERFNLSFSPLGIFDEFRRSIHEELGLRLELQNGEKIARDLKGNVSVPVYHPELVTDRVLVQNFALGKKLSEIDDPKIRKIAVENIGRELLNQLLKTGVFHDDLHPGNFRIDPKTGHVELLDFGRIGILNTNERSSLIPLLMSVKGANVDSIIDTIYKLSSLKPSFDRKSLQIALTKALSEKDLSVTNALGRVFFECGKHGLPVNSAYLRVLKAVLSFEGTAHKADPSFNFEKFVMSEYLKSLFSN